jgi:isopentenyl-diphosphate delta-isomerase
MRGGGGVQVGDADEIARRKGEHLQLAADGDVETHATAGWEDVNLIHDALPTIDAASIDLTARFLGHTLKLPLVISGMTGGHGRAIAVNELLARVAEKTGIAIGVGSQRAALRDPTLIPTYSVVRETAPHAFVIANVGISQLVKQGGEPALSSKDVREIVKMVGANALALHLNYLEESVQPEGQTRATGTEAAVRALTKACAVPVIAKETGAGISRTTALRLRRLGVKAIDVGGVGGTSFAAIEGLRARERGDALRMSLGERLRDWGLPTAVAVVGVSAARLPIIATGGVRSGVDAAKALALGATIVGVGRPLLQAALKGEQACLEWLAAFELELRTAVFLSGIKRASDLRRVPIVITGRSKSWLDQLAYRRALVGPSRSRASR